MVALLESKFNVPGGRPGAVGRPRLTARLAVGGLPPLTVAAAPAGFGKTTVLAEWLATLNGGETTVAWLSLDRRDDDPTLFWTYVVRALQVAVPGVGVSALQTLPSSTDSALTALFNDLNGLTGI